MSNEKAIIKASTPNSDKYYAKIDVYNKDPKSGPHDTVHIAVTTEEKEAHIIDKFDGKTNHTDVKCYLTTACMRYFQKDFDDNCYELKVLRWFRDNFVTSEDIKHYYAIAPIIVEGISREKNDELIYNYIFDNVVDYCVEQIELGNYSNAYNRYKSSILVFEEQFAKPLLHKEMIKTLKLQISGYSSNKNV